MRTLLDIGNFGLAVVFGLALSARDAQAQQELQSTEEDRSCSCRIVLSLDLLLRSSSTAAPAISPSAFVARGPRGSYVVGPSFSPGELLSFDSAGSFRQSVGRFGQGPGELGRVRFVGNLSSEVVGVLDGARLSAVGSGGRISAQVSLPPGVRAFRFAGVGNGHIVVNNYMPGHPAFVLLDSSLTVVRSFGPRTPEESKSDSDAIQYWVASLGANRFAAVARNYRYGVEVWSTGGTRISQRTVEASWFERWTQTDLLAAGPGAPPFPRVEGVFADSLQQVWILGVVTDRRAPNRQPPRRSGSGARVVGEYVAPQVEDFDTRFDTVLDVVDPTTGRVLVSQRFDRYLQRFTSDGRIYTTSEGPDGLLRVEIWKPRIVQVR